MAARLAQARGRGPRGAPASGESRWASRSPSSPTPSGRRRAALASACGVTVVDRGKQRVVLPRPSLSTARRRVPTYAAADASGTRLVPIGAGKTVKATLQTAGAVTEQLVGQRARGFSSPDGRRG